MRLFLLISILFAHNFSYSEESLMHASFDITRELYRDINNSFSKNIKVLQSHAGSGKQTLAIIHGLRADIVSLALPLHMDILAEKEKVAKNWRSLYPNSSSPMSTHIVFVVRKDNPKKILDWSDLIRPDIKVIIGNPKTSGGALWNYAAAWIFAQKNYTSLDKIEEFMHKLYHNAPVLDSTARNSAITFMKRKLGDVLVTWNCEAKFIVEKLNSDYEIITPSVSLDIKIPIAITSRTKKRELADKYIKFLYSKEGQSIISKHFYNNLDNSIYSLINPEEYINWKEFKAQHFKPGGLFDKIYS